MMPVRCRDDVPGVTARGRAGSVPGQDARKMYGGVGGAHLGMQGARMVDFGEEDAQVGRGAYILVWY